MKNKYRNLLKKESPNLYKNYESIMLEQFELFANLFDSIPRNVSYFTNLIF